jgi:hypothetical protein
MSRNPVILSVIHHRHNPLESNSSIVACMRSRENVFAEPLTINERRNTFY